MKKNKFLLGGTILMLAAKSVWGAETASNDQNLHYGLGDYYKAGELSLDGFGSASLGQFTSEQPSNESTRQDIRFGAGAGVNYFITRYFGIGADAYSENTTGTFIDSTSASLILRRPLGQSGFAPYALWRWRPPLRCGQSMVRPGGCRRGISLQPACGGIP